MIAVGGPTEGAGDTVSGCCCTGVCTAARRQQPRTQRTANLILELYIHPVHQALGHVIQPPRKIIQIAGITARHTGGRISRTHIGVV